MKTKENIYRQKNRRLETRRRKGRTGSRAKQKVPESLREQNATIPAFGSVCDEWLQCSRIRLKESSCVKYQTNINKYIRPFLGDVPLSDISSEIVGKFGSVLLEEYGLAPKTTKDILVLVHSILAYGVKYCPDAATVKISYPQKHVKEMRVLSRAEQRMLTEYLLADVTPCKFGVLLALWTGMRIGEICALRWEHIFQEEQVIKVEATMQRLRNRDPHALSKTSVVQGLPKTVSSMRTIPMSQCAAILCRRMDPHNPNAYVLTGTEKHMEPRLLQYHFRYYTSCCELSGVTFHTLRHTFATRCVEVDFEIKSLSEILGHANISVTLSRYVHCSMELKRENMKKLESMNL